MLKFSFLKLCNIFVLKKNLQKRSLLHIYTMPNYDPEKNIKNIDKKDPKTQFLKHHKS